jgi:hypothetical protein
MKDPIINRFDKVFGPVGTSTGIPLILGGIFISWFSMYGLFLSIIGAFVAFTDSSTTIDPKRKMVYFSNNIFGILKFGKWIELKPEMSIAIRKNNQIYRAYNRSNRTLDIKTHNYQIILCDDKRKMLLPLKHFNSISEAQQHAQELADYLGITAD